MDSLDQHPGWQAKLKLRCAPLAGRTRLVDKQQQGPLTVQRAFHPEGAPCHLYLVHPPGGVVGGDGLEIDVSVESGGHALLTTPGATKCYRSAGETARIQHRLAVAPSGLLEWLPNESIFFPGARVEQRTEIALEGNAQFFGWELLSLGRPVIDEVFDPGWLDSRLRLSRDGRCLLDERLRIGERDGGWQSRLQAPTGLRGHAVSATLIATGATPELLELARDALDRQLHSDQKGHGSAPTPLIGLTLLQGGVLIGRGLGASIEAMHGVFSNLWVTLRPQLIGPVARPPRIWAT